MYNEKIEALIDAALADGVLTDQERRVLFKNAEAEGIDLDEFEMVLEAKLHKQLEEEKKAKQRNPSNKQGDVRKCSGCGAVASSFATHCPDCGIEFRGIDISESIVVFFEKLGELEAERSQKDGENWSITDSRKEELILNFPIPNSKEDILEFITLATSRIYTIDIFNVFSNSTRYKRRWNQIWLNKISQIKAKAALSMRTQPEILIEIEMLCNKAYAIETSNSKKFWGVIVSIITLIVVLFASLAISYTIWSNNVKAEEVANAKLVSQIEALINEDKLGQANSEIAKLTDRFIIIDLKSRIQLKELTKELEIVEALILKKKYSQASIKIKKIIWKKSSLDWDEEKLEENSYKVFAKKKIELNKLLPEKYQVTEYISTYL